MWFWWWWWWLGWFFSIENYISVGSVGGQWATMLCVVLAGTLCGGWLACEWCRICTFSAPDYKLFKSSLQTLAISLSVP